MTMHWTEKAHAIASIGVELQKRGWTIFGYDPGECDGMTDYYRAAHWDGVAIHPQHPGVVVGVSVSSGTMQYNSGQKGWPTFHATPGRRAWHVEHNGQVVASGVGLEPCSHSSTEGARAVTQLVDAIEAAVNSCRSNGHTSSQPAAASTGGIRVQNERDWTWIFFPSTPSEAIREALRSNFGASFSKRRIGWYVTRHVEAEEVLHVIEGADKSATVIKTAPISGPVVSQPEEDEAGPCGFVAGKGSAYDYIPAWMQIPKLYASENAKEPPLAVIKLFNPDGAWTYYILEWDGKDDIFGLVAGMGYETELGYGSLDEIRQTHSAQLHLQMERDLWFKPTPVTELDDYQEKWGTHGPYNNLQPATLQPTAQEAASDPNGDGSGDDWEQTAQRYASEHRRNMGIEQYVIPMGQVDALPFTTTDDSRIQVYRMGRDVLLNTGEVVTIAGFHTVGAWPLIEALQPGDDLLPSDFSYEFEDGHHRQIWKGNIQGVLLDQQQLTALARTIPQIANLAQPWPLFPLDLGEGRWEREDIEFLIDQLADGQPILVDRLALGIWSVEDFTGLGTVENGQQVVKTFDYTIRFDADDAMAYAPSGNARYTFVETLRGNFPYDTKAVIARLQEQIEHSAAPASQPAHQPEAPAPDGTLPAGWTVEDVQYLLTQLEKGTVIVSDGKLGIPTIHDDFGAPVDHAGFGVMVCKGPGFEVSFDAGGAMQRTPSGHGWSRLLIRGDCPYKYDADAIRAKLQSYLPAQVSQPKPAPAQPQPVRSSEPWEISRTGYMMSKATFAGGVPIMNAADGNEHKQLVIEALRAGKPVPASVLEDYPDLEQELAEQPAPPVFTKQLTGDAALDLLRQAASIVPEMSGVGAEPAASQPAPAVQQQAAPIKPADAQPAPAPQADHGPENEAELKEYELEIMTGRVDKRASAFYNTIARVQPGTLRLALQRIPSTDTRRRQEIERRLGVGA